MTDIILVILLVALVAGYIFAVSRRKKQGGNQSELVDEVAKNTELEQLKKKHFMERMRHRSDKQIDSHLVDYSEYHLSMKEYILYAVIAIVFFAFVGYLFYESVIAAIILGAAGLFYPKIQKKALLEKRKEKIKAAI